MIGASVPPVAISDRVFVRAIQGEYNLEEELKRLRSMPRVREARVVRLVDGPQAYSRHYIGPKDGFTQTVHLHVNGSATARTRIGSEYAFATYVQP